MKGIKLISLLLVVSGFVALVSAQWEEEIDSFDDNEGFSPLNSSPDQAVLSPPETPLPPGTRLPPWFPSTPATPFPPEAPSLPGNTNPPTPQIDCEDNCALDCSKVMLVTDMCLQLCQSKCRLAHSELLYDCTNNCAQSMPASLMSDQKKTESYVNSCYKKCMKN